MATWMGRRILGLTAGVIMAMAASAGAGPERPVAVNQTEGFGAGQLLVFTYLQNFACIHEPFDDLDHNGQIAAVDPHEFQRPICTVDRQSTIGPTGDPIDNVEKLWVIVPFFETDGREPAFTKELGDFVQRHLRQTARFHALRNALNPVSRRRPTKGNRAPAPCTPRNSI